MFNKWTILPQKSIVNSRKEVDLTSNVFNGFKLKVPIISANMNTSTNAHVAKTMFNCGGLGVLSRHKPMDVRRQEAEEVYSAVGAWGTAISLGLKDSSGDIQYFKDIGINIFFIDVANCYTDTVIGYCKMVRSLLPTATLVVGNTVCRNFLQEINGIVDAVKVGIGSGHACATKDMTGVYMPQFSALRSILKGRKIAREDNFSYYFDHTQCSVPSKCKMPIISDGGIREFGDIAKAIGIGASSVMIGKLIAQCIDSPAKIYGDGLRYHQGSSDSESKKVPLLPTSCYDPIVNITVEELMAKISWALKSSISYSGANSVTSFQERVQFYAINE